jgi:electron transfer flavoprotein alpha/beta subunit
VNDTDLVSAKDWPADPVRRFDEIDISFAPHKYAAFDESALELALRCRERNGGGISLTALTFGDADSRLCKNLYAVGFDRVVHLTSDISSEFSPSVTASAIVDFVRDEGGYDLILTGQRVGRGDSGKVPLMIAEYLSLPLCTNIAYLPFPLPEPMVAVVGNTADAYLRIPTLKEKLEAKARVVEQIAVTAAKAREKEATPLSFLKRQRDKTCSYPNGSVADKARAITAFLYEHVGP